MLVQTLDAPVNLSQSTPKPVTVEEFEQFLRLSTNQNRLFELIHGEIVEKTPTEEHGILTLAIGAAIRSFVKQHQLGRVGVEIRYGLLTDRVNSRLPDVSFTGGQRPVVREGAVLRMPDLAIEIKSPNDTIKAMRDKAEYYLENGVKLVWLIYSHKRFIEVYTTDHESEILFGSDVLTGGDVMPGFSIPVVEVFADLE